jgi:hypothetical protein
MCGRIFSPAAEFFCKSGRILMPGVGNTDHPPEDVYKLQGMLAEIQ